MKSGVRFEVLSGRTMVFYGSVFFKASSLVILKIEREQSNFLWFGLEERKRDNLITWQIAFLAKKVGRQEK